MADPTGLVSLGIEGVGGIVRVRKRWKERHKVIKNLAAAAERADLIFRRDPSRDELEPLIAQAIVLLDRFSKLKRPVAMVRALFPEKDIAAARRLVDAFKQAEAEAESRLLSGSIAGIERDIRTVKDEKLPLVVAECKKLVVASSLLSMSFFFRGKPA